MVCRARLIQVPAVVWVIASGAGCGLHTTGPKLASKYATATSPPAQDVRVAAVLLKTGEKVDFPEQNPAFLTGGLVVAAEKGDGPVTVEKKDATFTRRDGGSLSVAVKGKTFENVLVVSETKESIRFLQTSESSPREIALDDIDKLWLREERAGSTAVGSLGGIALLWGLLVIVVMVAGFSFS
jgi:hypothetical protein